MKTRIYITGHGQQIRLIRAQSKLQALDFASKGIINISAVKKDELAEHVGKGLRIEDATGGTQEEVK